MSTLGKNVELISIEGKFDDCQALVKQAFTDPKLAHLKLSSANSINIGRLIPQTMYYFYAWAKLVEDPSDQVIFSVPSGNFGDLMGGLIAKRMGLPVKRFVVATNSNDEYPSYYNSGIYKVISPSRNCISSAMNVGHPSNVARLIALYGGCMDEKGVIHIPADYGQGGGQPVLRRKGFFFKSRKTGGIFMLGGLNQIFQVVFRHLPYDADRCQPLIFHESGKRPIVAANIHNAHQEK